jgi:hypothetical protein
MLSDTQLCAAPDSTSSEGPLAVHASQGASNAQMVHLFTHCSHVAWHPTHRGQVLPKDAQQPVFKTSGAVDFELEVVSE